MTTYNPPDAASATTIMLSSMSSVVAAWHVILDWLDEEAAAKAESKETA